MAIIRKRKTQGKSCTCCGYPNAQKYTGFNICNGCPTIQEYKDEKDGVLVTIKCNGAGCFHKKVLKRYKIVKSQDSV